MNLNKTPSIQTYRLLVYQRALHPELFNIQNRKSFQHGEYEVECWILPGGHLLRFQYQGKCVSEVVVDQEQNLPQRGLMQVVPCLGEKELEQVAAENIRYVSSVQTELLSDNLFAATYEEMKDFATQSSAICHEWVDKDGTQNLSLIDIQRYRREIHAQGYHLIGSASFVLRTQSIFEIVKN